MNRILRSAISTVVFLMLTVVFSTTGHGFYDYSPPEEVTWQELSFESGTFSAGTVIAFLPNGARSVIIERTQYFVSGGNWFLPIINKDGVKYRVVFAPV